MNGIKKVLRIHLRKVFEMFQERRMIVFSKKKKRTKKNMMILNQIFLKNTYSIRRSLLPEFPQDTTINKVIEQISKNSGITE